VKDKEVPQQLDPKVREQNAKVPTLIDGILHTSYECKNEPSYLYAWNVKTCLKSLKTEMYAYRLRLSRDRYWKLAANEKKSLSHPVYFKGGDENPRRRDCEKGGKDMDGTPMYRYCAIRVLNAFTKVPVFIMIT
jgi:hypothetical protein